MLGDVVEHQMHVHESPVARDLPQIIATTDDLVVINKPAGMPVSIHPPPTPQWLRQVFATIHLTSCFSPFS